MLSQERRCQVAKLDVRTGWFSPTKTERDHLNIEKLTALFVVMTIHYLINVFVKCDTNILKMHMCANIKIIIKIKKQIIIHFESTFPI